MPAPVEPVTAQDAYAITASDTTVYQNAFSALYIGTTGNITIRTIRGNDVLLSGVPAGFILPVKGDMVKSTGTTAANLVGLVY